ncbi:MAG: SH3 domain-containing protein [Anaerolineae bacterium]|nr:SH3 domain-containing protein [Anaerolineae bacterium]
MRLPASDWWLVVHNQCSDTLHWINASGEFASIQRPALPNEAAAAPCSFRAMHISQDGRYLAQTTTLTTGLSAVSFYDLQTGAWLRVYEAAANEAARLGDRYSSDHSSRIAVSFSAQPAGTPGWRVVVFDMTTGAEVHELRSGGTEIAGFVGGEFLASTPVVPYVLLLGEDSATLGAVVVVRFDRLETGSDPYGAVAWYPLGAPGVGQPLLSSPYTMKDVDLLPNGHAIEAYFQSGYAPGPPVGGISPITTNAVGLVRPANLGEYVPVSLFFSDSVSTVYDVHWGADGRIALFRRYDGTLDRLHWIRLGSAILAPLEQQAAQVLGVPTGFVFSTADGVYYMNESAASPTGPVFSDPALSGSMAFVWATAFGNPPLALVAPTSGTSGTAPLPTIVTATPDSSGCRLRSADSSTVNVRSGPGTEYAVLGQATGGMELPVIGYNGQWYVVNFGGVQGWMAGWVSTLAGNCGGLALIGAPAAPPTALPPPTPVPGSGGQPDLYVSEFALDPSTPIQGQPVNVRLGVYNQGDASISGVSFHIAWYPGENYGSPACGWDLDGLAARGGRILTCTYAGYPSPYASINTLVAVDTTNTVSESNEANNRFTRAISVTAPGGGGQPDLYVSEFSLDPATPVRGQPVNVRVGVYNQGNAAVSGTPFRIVWYPGENYPSPACEWTLDSMAARGGRILTCTYSGYPSPYASINTKVVVDVDNAVSESNEGNNLFLQRISVSAS